MSVKYFDKKQNKWVVFPGTVGAPGKDAYEIAKDNGYTGTKEDYIKALVDVPKLHELVSNINSFEIKVVSSLPTIGESNVIYFVNKNGSDSDVYDEYIYVGGSWEKIGNTEVDLSDYYTKEQVYSKSEVYTKTEVNNIKNDIESNIPEGTVVDSALSATSKNPVQNKVITNALSSYVKTADLNVTLGNYYTTNEVYTKEEVNDKIVSAGGGDVITSGDLATDYIIVGAGTKSIKNSGQTLSNLALKSEMPSLSGYATQSWVTNQGYSTENTWRPIKVGSTTLNDSSTTLTIANGTGIGLTFVDGTLTIINNASGSAYTLPVADPETLGGIKTGFNETLANIPVHVDHEGRAYVAISKDSVVAALQYTPANVSDIPTALPNPHTLNITAGGTVRNYNGSSVSNIDLDNIYAKKLSSVDTPGKPGLYFASSGPINVTEVYVTENDPDAIILVANTVEVTFGENYHKIDGIDSLSGGLYKCYCITYVRGVVLVNGMIYN